LPVQKKGSQFLGSLFGNARPLLDREEMFEFFDLRRGTRPDRHDQYFHFQVEGFGVNRQGIRKPAFEGTADSLSARFFPAGGDFVENFLANGRPKPPSKGFNRAQYGDRQTSTEKKHSSSTMHWSRPMTARASRSSRFMFAYMSGKAAAKLCGMP
jgi:hypothetical protein